MIKLKQLIKESLSKMVFTKTIKPKHKKRMNIETKMFPSNPKLTMTPPPANDSNETRTELFKLLAYNNGVIDRPMVKKYDDLVKPYMELIEKYNVDVTKDDLEQIIDEAAKFTLKIKYKFNRPRPYQIADHYGIEDFKRHKLDTANTPSYPSGHALQGRLVGLILTDKDPKHQNEYMAVAQKISDSRIMARAHYPSDKVYGEKLADELYDNIQNLKESLNKVVYTKPNFEFEWEEANRYPNLFSSKEDWLEKAKVGKMMTIDCDMNINNTDMCQPDVDDLEPAKLKRVKKMINSGRIELPIVIKHNGQYELIAGNTRLVGMVNNNITTKAWVIEL